MKVIIYQNPKGDNVCACHPTGELPIEEVLIKDCPAGAIIVDDSDLPYEHDEFFNAWRLIDGKVSIDFNAAQELTKDRLRIERAPLLTAQDVLFQRALETGSDTSAIIAEKQRLRDITKLADQAKTLDELKLIKAQQ